MHQQQYRAGCLAMFTRRTCLPRMRLSPDRGLRKADRETKSLGRSLFAEARTRHGLRRFRLRGSERVGIEALVIAGPGFEEVGERRTTGMATGSRCTAGLFDLSHALLLEGLVRTNRLQIHSIPRPNGGCYSTARLTSTRSETMVKPVSYTHLTLPTTPYV